MEPISISLIVFTLAAIILYSITIYDLLRNRNRFTPRINHALWLMLVVFVPVAGSVVYLSLRPKSRW